MAEFWKTLWRDTSLVGRIGFLGGVVGILGGLLALLLWLNRSDYQPLFTDMQARDMAAVAAALDKQKIPYEMAEDGTTILVDQASVYKTRMKLMGGGVALQGGVGLELFNNTEFGMTEFTQRVNYQRALQGELERTITGFEEVEQARVHLVLADGNVLRKKNQPAKASVWITLKGRSSLSLSQVSGIQRLIAASVAGIEPSAVTILDQTGVALSQNNQYGDGFYVGNPQLQLKQEVEAYFATKVGVILADVVGADKAAVAVDVALNYDHIQTTRETVLPAHNQQTGVLVRQRERTLAKTAMPVGNGLNSADVMAPPAAPVTETIEVDYQVGKEVQQVITAPGSIVRLNVGVMLPAYVSEEMQARLQQVIAMAVGLDEARGDGIVFSVLTATEAITESIKATEATSNPPQTVSAKAMLSKRQWLWLGGGAVGVLFLLTVFAVQLRRSKRLQNASTLSEAERAKILVHVKQWLEDDASMTTKDAAHE